jgi:pimeloyl-ACP methyl ester carboxylesterase
VVTRPAGVSGALPAIFLTQWVSCDGIEPLGGDAWNQVLRGLITRSRAVFLRVDRAGGGDSQGAACHELDYDTEVAHYRHALETLLRDPGIDPDRVVVFGMSLGSTTAPLVAQGRKVAGVIASGGGAHTFYERMLAFDRLGFERGGATAAEIDGLLRRSAELHVEYLLRGRTPAEIAAARPDLGAHWARIRGTSAHDHYGRPFAWHRQAARRDFAAAWAALDAPVLVVYGEYDQFEPPAAHRAIGQIVERVRPGRARVVEVPRMNHFYRVFADPGTAAEDEPGHDAPELALTPMLAWLRERFGG